MMTKSLEPLFMLWPMSQFEKDFDKLEKIGEGQYGKVFSVKRKDPRDKRKHEKRY